MQQKYAQTPDLKLDLTAMGLTNPAHSRLTSGRKNLLIQIRHQPGSFVKVESGRLAPTVEILVRLANEFGKSLDWIVAGKK